MQVNKYKYYLRFNDAGTWKYYYVNTSGVVSITTTKTAIQYAPNGWRMKSLSLERGFEYWGVLRNFSLPLKFVKDGAKILRSLYATQGTEAVCEFYIEKFNNTLAVNAYQAYYSGDLNFIRASDMKDYFEIQITESGFLSEYKAKESTDFEIDLQNNADVIWVEMDGHNLKATTKWVGIPNEELGNSLTPKIPSFSNYLSEGVNLNMVFYDQYLLISSKFRLMQNVSDAAQEIILTYDYYYNIFIDGGASSGGFFTLCYEIIDDSDQSIYDTILVYQTPTFLNPGSSATYIGTAANTFDVPAKHSVVTTIRIFTTNGILGPQLFPSAYDATQLSSQISLLLYNKYPTSYVPALRPVNLAEQLIAKIDSNATFDSTLLPSEDMHVLTSGDGLRGLDDSVIKTNFLDFYKAMYSMYCVYMGYDNTTNEVNIDSFDELFDYGTLVDIGEVRSLKTTPFTQAMCSKVNVGYPTENYNDINGKDEYNIQLQFQSDMKRVTNTYDIVSPYRADMYGIEKTRVNWEGRELADSSSDNNIFWLEIESTSAGTVPSGPGAGQPYFKLYRDSGLTLSNVDSPDTAFNIGLSPKRRLLRHGSYLKSGFHPFSGELTYISATKSLDGGSGLETTDGVTTIVERKKENLSSLTGSKVFYPYQFEIETHNATDFNTLLSNTKSEIRFTYKGVEYFGFILEVGDMPTQDQVQTFKLICSVSTNLNNLIV